MAAVSTGNMAAPAPAPNMVRKFLRSMDDTHPQDEDEHESLFTLLFESFIA
jgi:hypothetical protein